MACLIFGNERIDVTVGVTIEDTVTALGKHPDAFLFLLNGKPVPVTMIIEDEFTVDVLRVASGG